MTQTRTDAGSEAWTVNPLFSRLRPRSAGKAKVMISRRDFLKNVSGAAIAAGAVNPVLAWADNSNPVVPGKEDLIVRSYRFLDLETPIEYFHTWLTPAEHFFVRNHMHEPST